MNNGQYGRPQSKMKVHSKGKIETKGEKPIKFDIRVEGPEDEVKDFDALS
jgi:hypothetical protein